MSETSLQSESSLPSRIPIYVGLRAAAEELPWGKEREPLLEVSRQLESGKSLQEIIDRGGKESPFLETLQAGIESGRLTTVLEEYLRTGSEIRDLWRTFWVNLFYPIFVLTLTLLISSVFLVATNQAFKSIFDGFGIPIGFSTFILFWCGHYIYHYWWFFLVLLLLIVVSPLIYIILSTTSVLPFPPFFGGIFRGVGVAEFCSRLAVLIDARLPLPRALEILSKTLRSRQMQDVALMLSRKVSAGQPADMAASEMRSLPPQVAGLFMWTESPETLADGLRVQAQILNVQSRLRLAQISFLVEPLLYIVLAVCVVVLFFAFFAPLGKLLNDLS
ncbi:MAG TPA: type II secretion system F family protein [Planctomicrobium sp.]|nr:type II secretion system F family protein [Planctomicrobium sp.]